MGVFYVIMVYLNISYIMEGFYEKNETDFYVTYIDIFDIMST